MGLPMVKRFIDLKNWRRIPAPTNICCRCLKQPFKEWMISGDTRSVRSYLCEQCNDRKEHMRCCLCMECAREEGVLW